MVLLALWGTAMSKQRLIVGVVATEEVHPRPGLGALSGVTEGDLRKRYVAVIQDQPHSPPIAR